MRYDPSLFFMGQPPEVGELASLVEASVAVALLAAEDISALTEVVDINDGDEDASSVGFD